MHKLYEQREAYLSHALDLSNDEHQAIQDFNEWLPGNIIDAHAHSNLPEHVEDIADSAYTHMLSTFPSFSIEESETIHELFHPGKSIRSLRFAKTFRGINHYAANAYLLENSSEKDRVALFGLPEDIPYTTEMLADSRVSGLKMYYSYLQPPATKIYDIFKPEILEAASNNEVPIVLHTPKMIAESVGDVLQLVRDFPTLKIAIAHLGSSKFDVSNLQAAYSQLAQETNVYLDTALNPSPEVCKRAIDTFGADRIMYGSDEPLNLIRSVPYIHPKKGQRIATVFPYHWQNPEEHAQYKHLAEHAVHSHWLSLAGLRKAIEAFPQKKHNSIKTKIFHDNAAEFYGF